MRWFAAFWITVVLCVFGAGLSWLGGQDFPVITPALSPFDFASKPSFIPASVVAVYLLVRLILQRAVAYTESAIEASPRESRSDWSRRRAALGLAAYRAFGNPTGRWLLPFALVLDFAAILVSLITAAEFIRAEDRWAVLGLTLLCLYAYTVTMAMLFPDRPIRLRPEPEWAPDPVLDLPGARGESDTQEPEPGPERAEADSRERKPAANKPGKQAKAAKPPRPPRPPKEQRGRKFWRREPPKASSPAPAPVPPPAPSPDGGPPPGSGSGLPPSGDPAAA